jgi:serine protease Do
MSSMSRRFALVTLGLTATVAFLVGLIVAGSMMPSAVSSESRGPAAQPAMRPVISKVTTPGVVNFADVAERINPAVVDVDATVTEPLASRRRPGLGPRNRNLLDGSPQFGPPQNDVTRPWAGSGFLIDADGHILTNNHVVERAERITVKLSNGASLRAHVVGRDPDTDIALIKVEGAGRLPAPAPLGDSDTLRVGEWVCAIGNPLAYEHTVTVGVVSYIGRKLFDRSLDHFIQTDAAINFGNSGGPLINSNGEVVGINTAISQRASNIGFAIPINQATRILPQLKKIGRVSRGYIGVALTDVTPDLQDSLRLDRSSGALVQDITEGSPGARAGLRAYDLIVSVDGQTVDTNDALIREISARTPGSVARLDILRDRRPLQLQIRLAERPARTPENLTPTDAVTRRNPIPRPNAETNLLGVTLRELDRRLPRATSGVFVTQVEPTGPAAQGGIERGHVLLEINRQAIGSIADFLRVTRDLKAGDVLVVYVYEPDLDQRALRTIRIDGQ